MFKFQSPFSTKRPNRFHYVPRYIKEEKDLVKKTYEGASDGISRFDRRNSWYDARVGGRSRSNTNLNKIFFITLLILLGIVGIIALI